MQGSECSDVTGKKTTAPEQLEPLWAEMQGFVGDSVRREQFETWFRRARLIGIDATSVTIAVHNRFTRDWLVNYYLPILERAVEHVLHGKRQVQFMVDPEMVGARTGGVPGRTPAEAGQAAPRPAALPEEVGLLDTSDVSLNQNYRFDNFVVGPCNRFAHAACVGVSERPGRIYNPLFLHGSVGLGKTHLLQSLCHTVLERAPRSRILYLSCETFVNHFINALENGDLEKFRHKYRNVDLLVVDDIHILANKERTQEEFFHTFNTLYNAGKQIVLSSDSPPVDIPTLQDRLVSRFKWGLVTELEQPCYETRMAILKRKSRDRGHELPEDVARLLAERIDSNIRELEGAVNRVLGFAALSNQPVSVDVVRQCLRDLFVIKKSAASIEDILTVVTGHFQVKLSDLQSRKRTNAIAFPRQVAMYLTRRITRMSLEEIGGYFGGRDHSTVLYAVQKIARVAREDPSCQELIAKLLTDLQTTP